MLSAKWRGFCFGLSVLTYWCLNRHEPLTNVCELPFSSIFSPNNLVLTGEDTFYVTNFFHSTTDVGRLLEIVSFRKWGNVAYFDGQRAEVVEDGLHGANGIAMSHDGGWVKYITMTSQWASWHPKSPTTRRFIQLFVQANIKENVKVRVTDPL